MDTAIGKQQDNAAGKPQPGCRRRRIPLARKLIYACLPALVLALVLEVGARRLPVDTWFGVRPPNPIVTEYENFALRRFAEFEDSLYEPDPRLIYRLKPGAAMTAPNYAQPGRTWRITIAADGHRVTPGSQGSGRQILFFGDSITFGFWVDDGDTLPAQLAKYLREREGGEKVQVINAGVPGYDSLLGRDYFEQILPRFTPQLVVIAFGMNDQCRKQKSRREILAGFRRNGGFDRLLQKSALVRTARRIVAYYADKHAADATAKCQVPAEEFGEYVDEMIRAAQAAGAQVLLLDCFIVTRSAAHEAALERLAAARHVPLFHCRDALSRFVIAQTRTTGVTPAVLGRRLMWEAIHPTAEGFAVIAAELADPVRELLAGHNMGARRTSPP
jgi:lysophospholipase L1-like esterase